MAQCGAKLAVTCCAEYLHSEGVSFCDNFCSQRPAVMLLSLPLSTLATSPVVSVIVIKYLKYLILNTSTV